MASSRPTDDRVQEAFNSAAEDLWVDLGTHRYRIALRVQDRFVVREMIEERRRLSGRSGGVALLVCDHNTRMLAEPLVELISSLGISSKIVAVSPGETAKQPHVALQLIDELVDMRADRSSLIVAVGGGVIGDLAGFVAAIYARGIDLLMMPTTLLAQVDSSVGGKVAVNHPKSKNLIGAFHQPIGVCIDLEYLVTLPDREYRSGLAEVLKYGVIADAEFYQDIVDRADDLRKREPAQLIPIIRRCCQIKADVVRADERETSGRREILNFGHTVAHAIEAVAGYGHYLHGEAVALGMVAETRLAEHLGLVEQGLSKQLTGDLAQLGLEADVIEIRGSELISAMRFDKKNRGTRIRFVLPTQLGSVKQLDLAEADLIRSGLFR